MCRVSSQISYNSEVIGIGAIGCRFNVAKYRQKPPKEELPHNTLSLSPDKSLHVKIQKNQTQRRWFRYVRLGFTSEQIGQP